MRRIAVIASLGARHAIAAGAVFVAGCVFWTATYAALLIWALATGGGLGSPAVYPLGLLLLLAGTTAASLVLFLPATLGGEALCRWRSWPTVVGIPISFAAFCLLSILWSAAARLVPAFQDLPVWSLATGIVLMMAVPLGFYWWVAESPHVVGDMVRTVLHSRGRQDTKTAPVGGKR